MEIVLWLQQVGWFSLAQFVYSFIYFPNVGPKIQKHSKNWKWKWKRAESLFFLIFQISWISFLWPMTEPLLGCFLFCNFKLHQLFISQWPLYCLSPEIKFKLDGPSGCFTKIKTKKHVFVPVNWGHCQKSDRRWHMCPALRHMCTPIHDWLLGAFNDENDD